MLNIYKASDRLKLAKARAESYRRLEKFRKIHTELVREFAGHNYGEGGVTDPRPYNVLHLFFDIYETQLVYERPQVLISTELDHLRDLANDYQTVLNQFLEDRMIEDTFRQWLQDALFSFGILKICGHPGQEVERWGAPHQTTDYSVEAVLLDDWVHDWTAKHWKSIAYCGDHYRITYEEAMDDTTFEQAAKKGLRPSERIALEDEGADNSWGRIETISRGADYGEPDDDSEVEEMVDLWDMWLPRTKQLVTVAARQPHLDPLRVEDWSVQPHGPYHLLSFAPVPGQIMPTSVGAQLWDMQVVLNSVVNKLCEQAEDQKTIGVISGRDKKDGEIINDTPNGETAVVAAGAPLETMSIGGPDAAVLGFAMRVDEWISRLGGNMDVAGSLGSQAPTATQEQILQSGVSRKMAKMQLRFNRAVQLVVADLAWRMWHDPAQTFRASRRVPNTTIDVPVPLRPDDRLSEFNQYTFKIDPYSMAYQSPEQRINKIITLVTNVVLPSLMEIRSQGGEFNWQVFLDLVAKYDSQDELRRLVTFMAPYEEQLMATSMEPPNQSPVTHRINERVNRPGTTRQGKDEAQSAMLAGLRQQPSQQAAMVRQAG